MSARYGKVSEYQSGLLNFLVPRVKGRARPINKCMLSRAGWSFCHLLHVKSFLYASTVLGTEHSVTNKTIASPPLG